MTGTEQKIYNLLRSLHVNPSYDGYEYITVAIKMCLENKSYVKSLTTKMYPEIAKKYGKSVNSVERGIRYAIEDVFANTENYGILVEIFGSSRRLTNKCFFAAVYEYLTHID
jgi:hypothetical protein